MWIAPEEKDPIVHHEPTRKSIGYFGAVCLRKGELFTQREDQSFNAQSFWMFLQALEAHVRQRPYRVVLISDNAKYHHAVLHKEWREEEQRHIALDYLPAYSPQLNPIERVWKLLRRRYLHNQHFKTLEEIATTVQSEFAIWSQPNETLRKLCDNFGSIMRN